MSELADWDIVTGVGITALGVAAGRAIETHRPDGLVSDPYAEAFVKAAAPPVPMPTTPQADTEIPWLPMSGYMGVRSRFFDEFFARASAAGIRQVVLLAAGLDVRAFRLDWPPDTTVYELDAPKVLSFKDRVLDEQNAHPQAGRRTVAVDLREDWASALRQAGFDPAQPTAWLAEGLLPFLPNDAKDRLFTHIHELSATGSTIAAEHVEDVSSILNDERFHEMRKRFGIDMTSLWPDQEDFHPERWLAEHGWDVSTVHSTDVAERYAHPLDPEIMGGMRSSLFVTAQRRHRD